MTQAQIVGLIIVVLGGLQAVRPDLLLRFQVWVQRVVMGAKYEPGPRTYLILRFIGALFVVFGLLALVGIFE